MYAIFDTNNKWQLLRFSGFEQTDREYTDGYGDNARTIKETCLKVPKYDEAMLNRKFGTKTNAGKLIPLAVEDAG